MKFQPTSQEIWASKYQLKTKNGDPVDEYMGHTYRRVAKELASVEPEALRQDTEASFVWAMENGAIPAGRILSNAGAQAYKPETSLINCTVSGTIGDSMDSVLHSVHQAGLTLKAGCGIGYEFSTLRPKGAWVAGAGATTSGPLSFMDIFDRMCATVSSAGGRRGAQMGTFDVNHPDILEFIQAKREDGRLRQFNLSLLITDAFVNAVKNGEDWPLSFPIREKEVAAEGLDLNDDTQFLYRDFPVKDGYIVAEDGRVACRIYRTLPAQEIWDAIMASNYDFAEPGFLMIDQVNELNNNWFCENIRASNPCGEQMLPPNGACLLGSVNLTQFVDKPFSPDAWFDIGRYKKVVGIFTQMLDNVVELSGLPLAAQREELLRKRRHGMGFTGLGSTLAMMGIRYGSDRAVAFTEKVTRLMAVAGWEAALQLAHLKGPAPIMKEQFTVTGEMLRLRPEMAEDGYKKGDTVEGRVLHARYSRYMQMIAKEDPRLVEKLEKVGARFTHHTSIAPTGTISLSMGNNASNGIEPSFSHRYFRNVIREDRSTKEKVEVAAYELLAYREHVDPAATEKDMPDYCNTSESVTPEEHVLMQAAAQKWVDASISKTCNVPTEIPFEDFKGIYHTAIDNGLKGCTTFRFNPEVFQGVLVREDDLKNTTYSFELEDGSTVELSGDEEVAYDGEIHTAANLFDALKEGTYRSSNAA